ncbi:MAG: VOC family protein [Planctomycetes bacterium]|nr:VOC family protein [Planctomycetota bacterium]
MGAKLALTILYVADLAQAAAFYDAAFGFPKNVDVPQYVEYQINGGACLGLMPQGNTRHFLGDEIGRRTPSDDCPRGEVYLVVDDPVAAVERLIACGAVCTSPLAARDWGDRAAYFLDPNGYVIAVAEKL